MHEDETYFLGGDATAANHVPAAVLLNADRGLGRGFLLKRLRPSVWLSRSGQVGPLGLTFPVKRLIFVAGLAVAFIILKCAFGLGGASALRGLRRSLGESGGHWHTVACGGYERDRGPVKNGTGIDESEPEGVTHSRVNDVFDQLEELQRICAALSVGRGIQLQTQIACFYLLVSSQELAAVSAMLPPHLETRRVQLTNSGSSMASRILRKYPAFAVGDNAFRRIRKLLELNNQLCKLPDRCTLGSTQCRTRLQHLGRLQLVFLSIILTRLEGLLELANQGRRPTDQGVSEVLSSMAGLRHTRRVQILVDHGLGPWVAAYLRLASPKHIVARARERQILLNNSLTPVDVLVRQLEEASAHTVDATERPRQRISVGVGAPRWDATAPEWRQIARPGVTSLPYPAPIATTSSAVPRRSSDMLRDSDLSLGEEGGSNATLPPHHPIFVHPPRATFFGPSSQPLPEPSGRRDGQRSVNPSSSWYPPRQSVVHFQAMQPASGPATGTQSFAPLGTVQSAPDLSKTVNRGLVDCWPTNSGERVPRLSAFSVVAQGEQEPYGTTQPLDSGHMLLSEDATSALNLQLPRYSHLLQEDMEPVSTSNLLFADTELGAGTFGSPASRGGAGDGLLGGHLSALQTERKHPE
ncbi:hypothetical protein, conserved [Eimeria acervulina]|uniref:Uncharacterized protein n=1 Tax=Eimeria acervulina TaxID=5801 RepID=U6GG20_EIMAC|nr:hypothetical protein, conserved [Eimeria acervulina]CDI77519.1 hypothetical protein, conserved [Eimeria acervulina]